MCMTADPNDYVCQTTERKCKHCVHLNRRAPLPRYFLHLWSNGRRYTDEEGDNLETLNEARMKAVAAIREIMGARVASGHPPSGSVIMIEDDAGRLAMTVTTEDALDRKTL